jgi:predicted RNA-binding protein Jag
MYDSKQELHEFVGDDRDSALEKAKSFFRLAADALEVFEFPSGAIYGLGGRTALVIGPRDRRPPDRSDRGGSGGGRGREGREERGRGGRERGGRERGGRDRDRGGRGGGGREFRESRDREAPREAAPSLSSEPSVGTVQGTLGEIGTFVCGVIERLDVGPFTIGENSDDGITAIEVKGDAARVLASGDGRAADALQLIANQVLSRTDTEGRVVLDIEGGSESREKHLETLAERVVQRAIDGGRAIALDPMNGRDRRTIHMAVREHEGVATMSIGEGRYRQVVVVPEGAPEYEEALQQSQGSDRS